MTAVRLDHVSYAAGPDGLVATTRRLESALGERFADGGLHPRFGTRNMVLPLAGGHYLEVVEVLDHPAADRMSFGQVVRSRTAAGRGWIGWVVAVDDVAAIEGRLGHPPIHGNRRRPDGVELTWWQVGVTGLQVDPQLPFFIKWEVEPADHPSAGATGAVCLAKLEIAGDPRRVTEWLGEPVEAPMEDIDVEWVAPHGTPGLQAAHFRIADGTRVRI